MKSIILLLLFWSTSIMAGGEEFSLPDTQKDCFELNGFPTGKAEEHFFKYRYQYKRVLMREAVRISKMHKESNGKMRLIRILIVCVKNGEKEIVGDWWYH